MNSKLVFALSLTLFEAVEPHMGTLVGIKLYARNEQQATAAFRAAFDRIAQLDSILSDYKADSELNRLPKTTAPVSADLFQVLSIAQNISEASNGAFDVTVGPLTRLWREARRRNELPSREALDRALSHCGFRKMHLDPASHTVLLDDPEMQLDLGGIAKGYAADEALAVLKRQGIDRALVAMSGDLVFTTPPNQPPWRIGCGARTLACRVPTPGDAPSASDILELTQGAVSTSGDSEQHLDANGHRYSHILNPTTGEALTNRCDVTVIAPTGVLADALATAISVLGDQPGQRLAAKYPGVTVLIRYH